MHADPAAGSTRQLVSSSISFSLNMPRSCLACSNITAQMLFYPSILCPGIRAQKKQRRSANSDKQKDLRRLWMQTQTSLIHRRWLPEMGTDSLRGWNGEKGRRRRLKSSSLCLFWGQRSLEETVGFQQPLSSCWRCSSPPLNLCASPPGSSSPPDVYVSASQICHAAGNTEQGLIYWDTQYYIYTHVNYIII